MIPDLLNNHLCGSTTNEVTNASTTQLLDVRRRRWSTELCEELHLGRLLPRLHEPGTTLGTIRSDVSVAGRRPFAWSPSRATTPRARSPALR